MKIKKLAAMFLAATMLFGMVGCGGVTIDGESKEGEAAETATEEAAGSGAIGFAVSTLNNPFFVTLTEGAQAKADELGLELIVVDAGDDTAKQTSDIEDLVSRNVSVLIVNPVDSDAVTSAVQDRKSVV